MDVIHQIGEAAIGSRLRRLSEKMTEEARDIYRTYDVDFEPKWFPVYQVLSDGGDHGISEIAAQIGHSHASVSQIVTDMRKQKWLETSKSTKDRRKTLVRLNPNFLDRKRVLDDLCIDVKAGVEELLENSKNNLWHAIAEVEFLLDRKRLSERVRDLRKRREAESVSIIEYERDLAIAFKEMNEEWIKKYFTIEPSDQAMLDHPDTYIMDKGGAILFAKYKDDIVGTCALINHGGHRFELAKMAVIPVKQGLGIGYILGKAIIDKARSLGGKVLFLESNTVLKPAINLYAKLGFKRVNTGSSPYARCNIQMEINL